MIKEIKILGLSCLSGFPGTRLDGHNSNPRLQIPINPKTGFLKEFGFLFFPNRNFNPLAFQHTGQPILFFDNSTPINSP